jgi:hypothetical protein
MREQLETTVDDRARVRAAPPGAGLVKLRPRRAKILIKERMCSVNLTISRLNTTVQIPAAALPAAWTALLAVAKAGKGTSPYQHAQHLCDLVSECWRLSLVADPLTGAIRAIAYEGEDIPRAAWESLFQALAPFVAAGSYIVHFKGQTICECLFDGRTVIFLEYQRGSTLEAVGSARAAALRTCRRRYTVKNIRDHSAGICAFTNDRQEARAWLSENLSPWCFASGAFPRKEDALAFVERLYQRGASEVCVTHVCDRLIDTLVEGGPYADALAIRLPDELERAADIREFCLRTAPPEHCGIITHETLFWEEAIPEGWIGMRWD